jgi:hypothetical protein
LLQHLLSACQVHAHVHDHVLIILVHV